LNLPGLDEKLRQSSAAGAFYFLQDHLGSVVALADATGKVAERMQYEAFGQSAGSQLTRYGYTGRERDELTGLLYYRARYYDPQQGRFLTPDPIDFNGGMNLYAYVANNPLSFIDPRGLAPTPCADNPKCLKELANVLFSLGVAAYTCLLLGFGSSACQLALLKVALDLSYYIACKYNLPRPPLPGPEPPTPIPPPNDPPKLPPAPDPPKLPPAPDPGDPGDPGNPPDDPEIPSPSRTRRGGRTGVSQPLRTYKAKSRP
jgi:RHS repeat-associated protein